MKKFFDFTSIRITDVILAILFVANLWLNGNYVRRGDYEAQKITISNLERTISVMQVTLNRVDDHEARLRMLENGRQRAAALSLNSSFYSVGYDNSRWPARLSYKPEQPDKFP